MDEGPKTQQTVIKCKPQEGSSKPNWRRPRYLCLAGALLATFLVLSSMLVTLNRRTSKLSQLLTNRAEGAPRNWSQTNERLQASGSHRQGLFYMPPRVYVAADDDDGGVDSAEVCMTPGCVRAAAQILNNMDNKTDPCQDFYRYSCGRWLDTQIIPDTKTSLSIMSQLGTELNLKMRTLVEQPPASKDPPIVGQMRALYWSCMNLSQIEGAGDAPLLEELKQLGGWPVLRPSRGPQMNRSRRQSFRLARDQSRGQNEVDGQSFDWLSTLLKIRQRGFSHDTIIDLSVVVDARNSQRYIIELDQASLGLPDRSLYFKGSNDSTLAAYLKLMVDSAVMLGADPREARRQMSEALEFETSLARISIPREERRNSSLLYNKMLAADLTQLAPSIDWKIFLGGLLNDTQFDINKDKVIVRAPRFIRAVDKLMRDSEPRIVANYLIWRVVRSSIFGLSRRWRDLVQAYSQATSGRQTEEPRWEQCLDSLGGTFNMALSALYVKNHFNGRSKSSALEMVEYIRAEFVQILDEIDWMDAKTKEEAKLKARAIAPFIGYPDELLKDELVEEYYKGIRMERNSFFANLRHLVRWSTNNAFKNLRLPNKRHDWKKHAKAAVVNAFYNSLENSIEFPAGILQGSYFDAERPTYLNYGAIGFVIGHEITHGFDDRGRQFDKEGNNRNWWNADTDQRFKERAQCIVDQYSNYTIPGTQLRVNGINTQGENIADNGGIKEAFRAYNEWVKRHGPEPLLPGIQLNQRQLFWVSAANVWCGKYRPEVLRLRVAAGSHSPAQFRVNGPMSNLKEFSDTFNCPVGSPLNPKKKCSVW